MRWKKKMIFFKIFAAGIFSPEWQLLVCMEWSMLGRERDILTEECRSLNVICGVLVALPGVTGQQVTGDSGVRSKPVISKISMSWVFGLHNLQSRIK